MSIQELKDKLARAQRALSVGLEQETLRAGADLVAVIENRVVTTGQNANGGAFSPYSQVKVPAFWFYGRSRNNAGEQAVKRAAKKKEGVSYYDFRRANGLNTGKKNFEFTGEMWQGFGVKAARQAGPGRWEVVFGGKTQRTIDLIKWHSQREGIDITLASEQEIQQVGRAVQQRLINSVLNA